MPIRVLLLAMMEQQIRMNITTGRKILVIGRLCTPETGLTLKNFLLEGLIPSPDHLLVTHKRNDKLGLWSFDLKKKV